MSCCESQEQEALPAERDYRRPGQRQHGSQRTLDRDRDCLALVCVVNCRDDPLATSTTLVRKYRAIFNIRWSDVHCKPQRGVEEL